MRFALRLLVLFVLAGCQLLVSADRSRIRDAGGGGAATSTGSGSGGGPGVVCIKAVDCPEASTECRTWACSGGACVADDAPEGTPLSSQVAGDCRRIVCDGAGHGKLVDDDDILDDHEACTADLCADGVPVHTTVPAGTACGPLGAQVCDGLGRCVDCVAAAACDTGTCANNRCVPATCADVLEDGLETDLDCGGDCAPCASGKACLVDADCQSGRCTGVPPTCAAPSCSDGILNGDETDLDCGGGCPPCASGQRCGAAADCLSLACSGSVCLPSCFDGARDGTETDIDCGGYTCAPCVNGGGCVTADDCLGGLCQAGLCVPATCKNGVEDGGETGEDCGGDCAPCGAGEGCAGASDCASGVCAGGICVQP